MQFRKGFLAAATATAVLAGGLAAPAQAEENNAPVVDATIKVETTTPEKTETTDTESKGSADDFSSQIGSSDFADKTSKEQADEIKSWLSVITAIIGVLTAVGGFAVKYMR
ncbi:hypothetical protein [Corynebacterium sp. LK2510]|uniref:hypothetical protein n=1 Tax=Corynebacterium sp. LK2510 TaxID=3110472 RepID=UPI0034CD45BF